MGAFLIEDILRVLAQNIECRATLSALCQVSKWFFDIFAPVLYRCIWLSYCPFATLSSISHNSHLVFTEEFHLGQRIEIDREDNDKPMEALARSLQKLGNLRSFTLMNAIIPDFAESLSEDCGDDDRQEDERFHLSSPLQYLLRCKELKNVTLGHSNSLEGFVMEIPPFKNLRKLDLYGLEREDFDGGVDDIAKVLLASPQLSFLGLSLRLEDDLTNILLREIINYYPLKRKKLGVPLLRLSELRLGIGFLPVEPRWISVEEDYLTGLTDLSALTKLRQENWYAGSEQNMQYWEIHPSLFARATCIRKISVKQLSPDVLELLHLLKASSGS